MLRDPVKRAAALARTRAWHASHTEHRREYERRTNRWPKKRVRMYGLTWEQWEAMLADQNGVCAICGRTNGTTASGRPKELAIDHDHATGVVRGLLCTPCNIAISALQEDPAIVLAAVEYLYRVTHHERPSVES